MGPTVSFVCLISIVFCVIGCIKSTPNSSFWSIEIPIDKPVTVYLEQFYILHITKAELSLSGPLKGITDKWARIMVNDTAIPTSAGTQICYLTTYNAIISQPLQLILDPEYGGERNVTFWLEDSSNHDILPVILSGYFRHYEQRVRLEKSIHVSSITSTVDVDVWYWRVNDPIKVEVDDKDPIDVEVVQKNDALITYGNKINILIPIFLMLFIHVSI